MRVSRLALAISIVCASGIASAADSPRRASINFVPTRDGVRAACAGIAVHLVGESKPAEETVAPACHALTPPAGEDALLCWLEGDGLISPQQVRVAVPSATSGSAADATIEVPLVPAASVLFTAPASHPPKAQLIQLERGFVRYLPSNRFGQPTLLPPGTVIATALDADGAVVGISRPARIGAGGLAELSPSAPRPGRVHLLARFRRPPPYDAFSPALATGLSNVPPDAFGGDGERGYAVWYDLAGKTAHLDIASDSLWLPRSEVALLGDGVVVADLDLAVRPTLHVALVIPPGLAGERSLEIRDRGRTVWKNTIAPNAESADVPHVSASLLDGYLHIGAWELHEQADLRDGRDGQMLFQPTVYHVTGTVYQGDDGVRARVEFLSASGGATVAVSTDANGRYEATLFRDFGVVQVALDGMDPPYLQLLDEELKPETRLDFQLPRSSVRVAVHSADTDEPCANASVSGFIQPRDGPHRGFTKEAGNDATVTIGPLGEGALSLRARAPGFVEASEEVTIGTASHDEIVIHLEREGSTQRVRVLLPDGGAAPSARVLVLSSPDGAALWIGGTGADGVVSIPCRFKGWLGVRHPTAALSLSPCPECGGTTETVVRLSPAAAPLRVQAVDQAGTPVWSAHVLLSVAGMPLGDAVAHYLLDAPAGTDGGGIWTASGLPQQPVEVVCWSRSPRHDPRKPTDAILSQRLVVPYPWPDLITLALAQ